MEIKLITLLYSNTKGLDAPIKVVFTEKIHHSIIAMDLSNTGLFLLDEALCVKQYQKEAERGRFK